MVFIPDRNTATTVLDKPSSSFIPDEPAQSSFSPDKPSSSFVPDSYFKTVYDEVAPHVKEILSFTPKSTFNLIAGLGTAMSKVGIPQIKQPFEVVNPEAVKKAENIIGLAGAAATGGWAFPAMFTADAALSPTLEKYVTGQELKGNEVLPDAIKGIIHNIGEMLGTNKDEAISIAKVAAQSAPDRLFGNMLLNTPEKKKAYGDIISAGLYLATMPQTVRKGLISVGDVGKEVVERTTAIPQIAKERALYTEQQRILEGKIAVRNPGMTPEQVKATAEAISGGKIGGVTPAIVETAIKTQEAVKPTPSFVSDTTPEAKPAISEIIPETIGKTIGFDADTGLPIIKRGQTPDVKPPEIAPVIEDLKGEQGIVAPTAKGGEINQFDIPKDEQASENYKSKGKDIIGRDIPDWRNAKVYHSTSKEGLGSISTEGFRVDLGSEQGGYYGRAVSFTPNIEYTRQFGEFTTVNQVSNNAKILNLNDPEDSEIFNSLIKREDWGMDMGDKILEGGYDGVYDAGAGDLFIYNPEVVRFMGIVKTSKLSPKEGGGVDYIVDKVGYEGQLPSNAIAEYDKRAGKVIVSPEFLKLPIEKQEKVLNHEMAHGVWEELPDSEKRLFQEATPKEFIEKVRKLLEPSYFGMPDELHMRHAPYRSGEEFFAHVYDLVKRGKKSANYPLSPELKSLIKSKLSPKEVTPVVEGGGVTPELQSLMEEAKKYKSADEFVNAQLTKNGLSIKSAVIQTNDHGKIYEGVTHSEAFQKAIDSGDIVEKGDKYFNKDGVEISIDWDLFKLNNGELIDRLTSNRYFGMSAGEQIKEKKARLTDIWNISKLSPKEGTAKGGEIAPELNTKFQHDIWWKGHGLTKAQALDKMAETGDFHIDKKINYKETEKANAGKSVFDYEEVYTDIIKYEGKEGGIYKVSPAEKEYFLKQEEYYKNKRISETTRKANDPIEQANKIKSDRANLEYNLEHSERELRTALEKYPESVEFWTKKSAEDKQKLSDFNKRNSKLSPKEGEVQKQAIDYYVDEFAKKLSTETGQPKEQFIPTAKKLVDAIEKKDVVYIRSVLNGINPNSNKLFTQITGKPAKRQYEVDAALQEMNPEAWDASKYAKKPVVETPKMSKEEALKKAQAARADKTLLNKIRFRGVVMTKKEMIDKLAQEGAVSKVIQENVIKDMTRTQYNRADGRQQAEHERRQKEAGLKNVYYISDPSQPRTSFQIGKTEYDYFNSLGKIEKIKEQVALPISDSANGLLLQASKNIPGLSKTQANIYAGIIAEHDGHSEIEANDMAEAIQYTTDTEWINEASLEELFDYSHKTKPIWDRIKELNFNKLIDREFEQSLSHVKSLIADLPKDAKELLRMYINSNNEIVIEGENRNRKIVQSGLNKIEKILEDYHSRNNTGTDPNQKMAQALQIAQAPESTEEEVSPDKSMAEKGFKLMGERKDNIPIANLSQFMKKSDKQGITADGAISNGRWAIKKGILSNVDKKFISPDKIDNYTLEKLTDIKGLGRSWEKLKEWGTFEGDENVYLLDKSNEVYAIDKKYYDYIVKNIKDVSFEGIAFNRPVKIYSGDKFVGIIIGKDSDNANRMKAYLKQPISTPSGNAMGALWHNDIPIEQGTEYYKLRSFETPELVRLVREVMGKYPDVVKKTGKAAGRFIGPREMVGNARIKIVAELFKQGNEKELGIVIAHEFGHLTDYMPEGTLKRGNILGRLLTLRSYLKNTFGELNNKEIRAELVAVTKYMHPFDEKTVPPAYRAYRMSSKELYAEAISLLLNSPGTMEKMAPKFTKAFFENIDKKLEVKQAYFDLLELLNGERTDILDALDEDIRRMFAQADPLRKQKLAEKKIATVSTFDKIRLHLDNKYHQLIKKIQNLEKQGIVVPIENNPKYLLEEYAMSNNAVYNWLLDMDKQVKLPLGQANIDIIDFGKYLFLKRVIGAPQLQGEEVDAFDDMDKDSLGEMIDASTGKSFKEEFTDRKNIANPLGIQPARAQEQLDYLKSKLGDEKFAKIEEFAKKYHELVFKVVTEAVKLGSYNSKVFAERIEPNKDTYVSFGVINYLQNFVSAGVKKQIGTLNEIENPFLTTVMKTVSLIKLNEKQRTMNSVRDFIRQYFPSEIQVSKKHKTTGGGVDWTETPGSFKILEDGRMVSYEIDPYIARSLKYEPYAGEIGQLLNTLLGNKIFKDIVITYNPGFALAFNPIRDFKRTYKSLNALNRNVSLIKLLTEYVKAMPSSYRRLQGIDDAVVREMIQNKALDIPFSDFHAADYEDSDSAYNELLKKYKLAKNPDELRGIRKTLLKPVVQILEFLRFHGSALESVSKITGYNILKSKDVAPMERSFYTRTYIGTPNFRTKGISTETTNAVFIFSNIMKEGLKSDIGLATNPKTRSGYWWATAKIDLLPKLLMVLAAAGLFGEGLKRLFDKASEYDKTNYIIIPLGTVSANKFKLPIGIGEVVSDGKSVYLRIPHDESGRLISAVFWKVSQALQGKPEQLRQIFAFGAGQMPQVTPALSIGLGWIQYLSGNNPFEPFRGGNVLADTEYKAGGGMALKKMVQWSLGEFGLTSFFTYNKDTNSTFESVIQLIPVINRLVKVSDAGISQDLRQIKKDVERDAAQLTLFKREEFKAGVKEFNKGVDPMKILYDISLKAYPGEQIDNKKFKILQKGFLMALIKDKENSPYANALAYATSNEEKKRILFKMKDTLPKDDFIKKAMRYRDLKLYSNDVMDAEEWKLLLL